MYTAGYSAIVPPMVSVYTKGVGWVAEDIAGSVPSSVAYESSNAAFYYPIVLPAPCVVRRVWWANGATTTGGATVEAGVYANSGFAPGVKLISGSATQGTASQVQFVDVTDTALAPGLYWLALMATSTTNTTFFRSDIGGGLAAIDAGLRMEQASANPLPATATPVETTGTPVYLCGFATTASP